MALTGSVAGKTVVLVLGDQLSPNIAALRACDRGETVVLMAEVAAEAAYVGHHRKSWPGTDL